MPQISDPSCSKGVTQFVAVILIRWIVIYSVDNAI